MIRLDLSLENGDNRMFLSIARTLGRFGHRVVVYAAQFDPVSCFPAFNSGLDVRVVPPRRKLRPISGVSVYSPLFLPVKIFDRLRNEFLYRNAARRVLGAMDRDFDIVIAQNDHSYQISSGYKKRSPSSRFVWIMNNAPFYHTRKSNPLVNFLSWSWAFLAAWLARRYARGIDLVVVNDTGRAEMVRGALGLPVKIIRIAVDFKVFFQPPRARKTGGKKATLLGVGSLSPARRFEDIIRVVGVLRRERYDARAVLVSKDVAGESNYRKFLLALADREGVGNFVDFRFEGVTDEELKRLQGASDVFVFPNAIDIWGMAAFEAMAAGMPAVVSRTTSVAEILADGVNAVFTNPADPEGIARAVRSLVDDGARYRSIAAAGQKFVKENLGEDSYVENLLACVASLQK